MRRCPECRTVYEDSYDICPDCAEPLVRVVTTARSGTAQRNRERPGNTGAVQPVRQTHSAGNDESRVFMQRSGFGYTINGAVAESQTQQYYQSRATKIIRAVFSGEPYQLSHTTFATIFRVEEHVTRGYPEQACDVTLYGNMQNVFATGDDVTVTARRRGSRVVARRVYNHSIDNYVRIQSNIPAGVIRFFMMILAVAIISLVNFLLNADYFALGAGLIALVLSFFPTIIVIALIIYFVRRIFGRR